MKGNTTVTAHIGCYVVRTSDSWGVQTYQVDKQKRCTCGCTGQRPCRHIRAVAHYLRNGGERAPEERPSIQVREKGPLSGPPAVAIVACPICDAPIERQIRGRWRCLNDSGHYFQWRGEQNGGAIREFFTGPHPNKVGAFYQMTVEERDAFLNKLPGGLTLTATHRLIERSTQNER